MCWLLGTKRGHVLKLPQTYHFQFHSSSTGSLSWNWNWNFHALHLSNSLRRQHPYSDISWKSGIIQCKYELKVNINTRPNTKVEVSINPIWTRHNRTFLFAVWSPNPSLPKMVMGNNIMAFLWGILYVLWLLFNYTQVLDLKRKKQRPWATSQEWTMLFEPCSSFEFEIHNIRSFWPHLSGVDMLSLDSLLEKLPALLRWNNSSPSWL